MIHLPITTNMELLQGPSLRLQPIRGASILKIVLEILLILTPHNKISAIQTRASITVEPALKYTLISSIRLHLHCLHPLPKHYDLSLRLRK